MSALVNAQELDAADDRLAAAREYEGAIKNGEGGLPVFVDLAVLYFTLLDPGEVAALDLGQDFVDQAWERANELLREAEERFGASSEIEFWRLYFEFIVLGAESFGDECSRLLNPDESLVPFLYLWAESGGRRYRDEARALQRSVARGATARERYIRGVLERVSDKPGNLGTS